MNRAFQARIAKAMKSLPPSAQFAVVQDGIRDALLIAIMDAADIAHKFSEEASRKIREMITE